MTCCNHQDLALNQKRYGPKFVQCIFCFAVIMRECDTNTRVPYGRVTEPGTLKLVTSTTS